MPYLAPLLTILLALPAGAASAAGTAGELRLQSQAGVEILWEGVALGKTDKDGLLIVEGILPGEYRLTLRKQGFHDLDTQIEMEEGVDLSKEVFLISIGMPGNGASERTTTINPIADNTRGPTEHDRKAAGAPSSSEPSGTTAAPGAAKLGAPHSPSFQVAMALLIALLAGTAVARLVSNRRKASSPSQTPPRRPVDSISEDDEAPVFEETEHGSPGFLEDLKRRERNLDKPPEAPSKRPEETIIEVEAVEITTDRPSTGG